ncbi:MAG: hypothetical protein LBL38_01910, partial [Lactobacillales bacterium]|nr:hypothetical protein [Lactobacillales bacterium]
EDYPPDLLDYEEVEKMRKEILRLKFENDILVDKTQIGLHKRYIKKNILLFMILVLFMGVGSLSLMFCVSPWNFTCFFAISFLGIILVLLLKWGHQKKLDKIRRRRIEDNNSKYQQMLKYFQQLIQRANLKEMKTFDDITRFYHQIEVFHKMLLMRDEQSKRLKSIRAQLAKFAEETFFLNDWLQLANKHPKDKFQLIHEFAFDMEAITKENEDLNSSVIFARIKSLEDKIAKLDLEANKWIEHYNLVDFAGIEEFLKKQQAFKEIKIRCDFMFIQLKEIFALDQSVNFEAISQQFKKESLELQKVTEEYQELIEEKVRLKGEKTLLENNGVLASLIQDEGYQRKSFHNLVKRWLIEQVETKILIDLLRDFSDQTLHELLKVASQLFSDLTSAQYISIELIEGRFKLEDENGYLFRVADLSTGAKDQLYLAMRMAFLFHRSKHYAPILVDDGWLHYDEKRKENLLKLFKEVAKKEQVILFSSDKQMHSLFLKSDYQNIVEL